MGQPESKPLFSSPLLPGTPAEGGGIPPAAGKSQSDGASEDEVQDLGVFRPASGITTLWVAELEQHTASDSDQSAVVGTDVEGFSTKLSSSTPDCAKEQDSVSNTEPAQGQPDEESEGRQAPGGVNSGDWYSVLDKVRLDTMPATPPRLHWNLVDSVVHTMMKNPEEKKALVRKPHPDTDSNLKEKDADLLPGSKYGQSAQEQVREKRLQDIERMKEKLDQALRRSSANIKAGSAPATDPTGLDKEDSAGKGIERERRYRFSMPRSSQGGVGILFLRSSKPKACSAGDCYYYIKEVVPDSPAQRAGLDSFLGYFLVQVDGVSTEGLSMEQVIELVCGTPGTQVALTFISPQDGEHDTTVALGQLSEAAKASGMQAAEREHPVGEKDNIDELLRRISGYTSEYMSNDEPDVTPERPSSTLSSTTPPLPAGLAAGGGHGSSTTLVVRMIECTPPPSLSKCSSVEEVGSTSVPQAAVTTATSNGNQGASDIHTEAAQTEMTSRDRPDTVVTSAPSGVEGAESVIPAVDGPAMQNAIQVFNEASSARVLGHIARAKVLYTEAASRFVQVSGAETFEALALRNANACEIGQ